MKIFPEGQCPACGGPITFFQVMSILTPFQSIECCSCGESVFLKNRASILLVSLVAGAGLFIWAFYLLIDGVVSIWAVNLSGFLFLGSVECLMTALILRNKDLVVRRKM